MTSLTQKLRLLRGLMNRKHAFTGPFFVDVDVTGRCNLHCLGCPYHSRPAFPGRPERDFPLSAFRSLCEELRSAGTRSIYLQGPGEPLLHPSLHEMIKTAKDRGFEVMLSTNGTLLDRETVGQFIETGLDRLKVSLWATTPEEYAGNYPGVDPSNLARTIEAVRMAAELKKKKGSEAPQILLHQPVNQLNCRGLEALVRLAADTGCDGVSFTPMHHHPGAETSSVLEPRQVQEVCSELRRLRVLAKDLSLTDNFAKTSLRFELGISALERQPCYAGWIHAHLRVDGDVHPCGHYQVSMGNIFQKSFSEIWNSRAYSSFRMQCFGGNGFPRSGAQSECGYCCLAEQNAHVHRFARLLVKHCKLSRIAPLKH